MLQIGIDIGGTNLRGGVVDRNGAIRARFRTESAISEGRDRFLGRLVDGIASLVGAAVREGEEVRGIGIGVPGLIDRAGYVRSSVNMRPLEGICLAAEVERLSGLPTVCGNDANLMAVGEQRFGAAQDLRSCVVITIGTGLGSGLILDGSLWSGSGGFAAEMGHMTVEPEGFPCSCGNRGCLEQYVSAPAIARAMELLCRARGRSVPPDGRDVARLAELARQGDVEAAAAFGVAGEKLGTALASLTSILNLEGAVITGGVAASLDLMRESITRTISSRVFALIGDTFRIRQGTLGYDAGLLGAAALAAAHAASSCHER